jgi:hypothetical protein
VVKKCRKLCNEFTFPSDLEDGKTKLTGTSLFENVPDNDEILISGM